MSNIAIKIENIGKQYKIGSLEKSYFKYKTVRESLVNAVRSPFIRVAKILKGEAYGAAEMDETIWALRGLDLEINSGEVVGVIGRNGAGKTTLLKILSRITEPSEGLAEIHGRVGSLLEVGTGFHPELTGRENILLNGAILGMPRKDIINKFDDIVEFAEIEKFIETPVKFYSSGMYVRLAFAVAAYLEPDILLVDEVLAVGDAEFQKKCLGRMDAVAKGGRTVLFVSHNMALINKLCSRCIVIDKGSKIADTSTQEAIETYLEHSKKESEITFDKKKELPAQILSAKVLNSKNETTKQIHYQEYMRISLRIYVREKCDQYHALVLLSDALNNKIILTSDRDITDSRLSGKTGICEYVINFPSKLLKPGNYYIRTMLFKRKMGQDSGGDLLSDNSNSLLNFEIVDFESRRSQNGRYGKAAVAPEIPWDLVR